MSDTPNDGRPEGWTELLALMFIGAPLSDHGVEDGFDRVSFATWFIEGDWPAIQKSFPEFQIWLDKQKAKN